MAADQLAGVMEQIEASSTRSKVIVLKPEDVKARVGRFETVYSATAVATKRAVSYLMMALSI